MLKTPQLNVPTSSRSNRIGTLTGS